MNELDRKILDRFSGKVVRKDLTSLMKKGANVPTYVLEYLLGMYCSTDDDEIIEAGIEKVKRILTENYVRPDQSEYVKSKIKEKGQYTIIDKIHVRLDEKEDMYVAEFTNLRISPFEISSDVVTMNDKLLIGGIWCMIKIEYRVEGSEDSFEDEYSYEETPKKVKKKKTKYDSPFEIVSLKPIQMPNLDLEDMRDARKDFTSEEWETLILRSAGYEPDDLSEKQKMHYLLRFVPFIQKNFNLVELGPRGTGKSHAYSELSPYSILMSSGTTTVSNMFYNMASRRVGLVGNWDCIAFDEVGGIATSNIDFIQIMKNFMANGTFARGADSISSDASIAFEGNTFRSVADMMRTTNLFEPFPGDFNNDSAFFDRIHAYLPGWETPKLRASLFTDRFGLITDCFAEFCHAMRKYDFTNSFHEFFDLNGRFNTRDDTAVRRTFSGLAKLLYPDEKMTKEEARKLLEYSIECRRRVKEQLRKMNPSEFSDVDLGYVDLETGEEIIVYLPEVADGTLIPTVAEMPGYVYAVGNSIEDKISVYRLENKLIKGSGKFSQKNVEGLSGAPRSVRDSLIAAFNLFAEKANDFSNRNVDNYDYSLYFNDLQSRGVSDELSVAEVVGLFSGLINRSVLPSLIICGRVVISGTMMPLTKELDEILVAAINAGAKRILLPEDSKRKLELLSEEIKRGIEPVFYSDPLDAVRKALDLNENDTKVLKKSSQATGTALKEETDTSNTKDAEMPMRDMDKTKIGDCTVEIWGNKIWLTKTIYMKRHHGTMLIPDPVPLTTTIPREYIVGIDVLYSKHSKGHIRFSFSDHINLNWTTEQKLEDTSNLPELLEISFIDSERHTASSIVSHIAEDTGIPCNESYENVEPTKKKDPTFTDTCYPAAPHSPFKTW